MANTLTEVIPSLLAQGLLALRENSIMPRLVNTDYSNLAAEKGDTINVPIPSAISVSEITAAFVAPNPGNSVPTSAAIELSEWYEAAFFLTDKDIANAMAGIIPMQASEAIKSLGNSIDSAIMGLYTQIYGFAGTVGTTPFSASTVDATTARKVLNKQLSPLDQRRFVLDPDAEANALDLRAFQDMSFSGTAAGIQEGQINRKLGFDWFMDQNAPTHTCGARDTAYVVNGVNALASKALVVKTGADPATAGDQFTIAGDSQVYVVTTAYTGGAGTMVISPGLKVATSGNEAITFKGTLSTEYAQNLAFHRDCFAFASRPLMDIGVDPGKVQSAIDPVSGLTLRLEVSREFKRTRFSYDILYGLACVRPELGVRLWGAEV